MHSKIILCHYKNAIIDYQALIKKMMFYGNFLPKNLVSSQKSSTFAAVFAPTAGEQRNRAKIIKKCNAENQPLTKKVTKNAKKVA